MARAAKIPRETIVVDLNKQRADGTWEHAGYTLAEAVKLATDDGSDVAWQWFKTWYAGGLTQAGTTPDNW